MPLSAVYSTVIGLIWFSSLSRVNFDHLRFGPRSWFSLALPVYCHDVPSQFVLVIALFSFLNVVCLCFRSEAAATRGDPKPFWFS